MGVTSGVFTKEQSCSHVRDATYSTCCSGEHVLLRRLGCCCGWVSSIGVVRLRIPRLDCRRDRGPQTPMAHKRQPSRNHPHKQLVRFKRLQEERGHTGVENSRWKLNAGQFLPPEQAEMSMVNIEIATHTSAAREEAKQCPAETCSIQPTDQTSTLTAV